MINTITQAPSVYDVQKCKARSSARGEERMAQIKLQTILNIHAFKNHLSTRPHFVCKLCSWKTFVCYLSLKGVVCLMIKPETIDSWDNIQKEM